ncbi:MAG: phosphotransferase [Desulfosarcina sp.]
MILEIHSHTSDHSACSSVSATTLVERCYARDLQGLVLTDHHYLWRRSEIDRLRAACAVPDHFVMLAGQEVSTSDSGDVLVYGADRSLNRGISLLEIRRRFPAAALVLAHPYRNGNRPSDDTLLHPALDAVEIFNSNQRACENVRALQDWHRLKFTAVAGTDVHAAATCGIYPTDFEHAVGSETELAGEIRAGRVRPSLSEFLRSGTSDLQVTELSFGGCGRRPPAERIIVKTHTDRQSLHEGSRSHRIMAAIAEHGFRTGPFRVPEPLDRDDDRLLLIEQGIAGEPLFHALLRDNSAHRRRRLKQAAGWLARLHHQRLRVTPENDFLEKEPDRLGRYLSILYKVGHRHADRIAEIRDRVVDIERRWYHGQPDLLIQGHGDYHPKNLFICRDDSDHPEGTYVVAIDFDSSYRLPPAFDVGTFLAQYENQLFAHADVLRDAPPHLFLDAYLEETGERRESFLPQVALFKARTALSIIYYLVKVGMGDSEDLWRVVVSAERSLTRMASRGWEKPVAR